MPNELKQKWIPEQKTLQKMIRMSPGFFRRILVAADKAKMSWTNFVRTAINEKIERQG